MQTFNFLFIEFSTISSLYFQLQSLQFSIKLFIRNFCVLLPSIQSAYLWLWNNYMYAFQYVLLWLLIMLTDCKLVTTKEKTSSHSLLLSKMLTVNEWYCKGYSLLIEISLLWDTPYYLKWFKDVMISED